MAHAIQDSFNRWGSGEMTDLWDTLGNVVFNSSTRFAEGRSLQANLQNIDMLAKSGFPNEQVWFVSVPAMQFDPLSGSTIGTGVRFKDGSAVQCSIHFRSDGAIVVYKGTTQSGTLQATFTSAFVEDSFDHWEIKVVIHNSVGEVHVRKNGAVADTFSATGLDLRGGSANNYANAVALHNQGSTVQLIEHIWFWNGGGAAPNDWQGDIRSSCQMALIDTADADFTRVSTGSLALGTTNNTFNGTYAAGHTVFTGVFRATQGGKFTSCTVEMQSALTGNLKLALYLTDGDKNGFIANFEPGTLVAVSNEVNNPTGVQAVTWPSDVNVINGAWYRFALMADASVSTKHGNDNGNGWKITTTTYGGGFLVDVSNLGDASAMVSVSPTIYVTALTATNAGCVSDMIHDDTTTYNSSANPGNEDLFTPNPLPYDPVGILAVNYFAQISKSSAAGKQARITGKGSSGTHFQSSAISPTTSFINYQFQQNTDPDTALAWTKAGFAASKLGYLVES